MTILRRYFVRILPLLILVPLASQAAPPAASSTVAVECENRYLSQGDAARVLHTDNFSQTYAKRQSLYANVARLCQGGVDKVVLLAQERQPPARSETLTVASR